MSDPNNLEDIKGDLEEEEINLLTLPTETTLQILSTLNIASVKAFSEVSKAARQIGITKFKDEIKKNLLLQIKVESAISHCIISNDIKRLDFYEFSPENKFGEFLEKAINNKCLEVTAHLITKGYKKYDIGSYISRAIRMAMGNPKSEAFKQILQIYGYLYFLMRHTYPKKNNIKRCFYDR